MALSSRSRNIDFRKIGAAISQAGIDPRYWCSHATVCVTNDNGECDFNDLGAIVCAPDGIWVDIILQPLLIPLTARLQLGPASTAHIQAPIQPGDEVLVVFPDGTFMQPPTIVAILNNQGVKIPLGTDKKPVFKNDRLLVQCGKNLPIEVHAHKIQFGDSGAKSPYVLGDVYKSEITLLLNALKLDVRPSPVGPIFPSDQLTKAIDRFLQNLNNQLSDFIFGQKSPPTFGT
jgi:hypothetical protein